MLANDPDIQRRMPEEYNDEEEEGEGGAGEPDRDAPSFQEHNFTFQAFEMVCSQQITSETAYLYRYMR